MDDFAMTCSYFVNALKMLISFEKHPISRANYGYTEKVEIDGRLYERLYDLSAEQFSANFDI